jgi:uncharacterized protein (DUF1697 family)
MQTYIALLRGINVSGQKKIKMVELKSLFQELGFADVRTYIQSGNVVFKARKGKDSKLVKRIEEGIANQFGFDVRVVLRTGDQLQHIIDRNPFSKEVGLDTTRLYVTLLERKPEEQFLAKFKDIDFTPDKSVILEEEIYLYYSVNYSSSKLNNNLLESKLKVTATTRNWRTLNELGTMAKV